MNPLFAANPVAKIQFPNVARNQKAAATTLPQFSATRKNSKPQMWTPFAGAYPFNVKSQAAPSATDNCTSCRFNALA